MAAETVHEIGPTLADLFKLGHVVVVALLIYFGGRKAIAAALKARTQNISKRLVQAKAELDKMKAETERARKELAGMAETRRKLISDVEEEGRKMAERLVTEARQTADRILTDAKAAAENEVRSATSKLRAKLVTEALHQSSELVRTSQSSGSDLQAKVHETLFERFLTELPTEIRVESKSKEKGVSNGH